MILTTDTYLSQFAVFKNINVLLDKYNSLVDDSLPSDEEMTARKFYNKWVSLAVVVGADSWTEKDWANFIVCMGLASLRKSKTDSISYALAGVGINFDGVKSPGVTYSETDDLITVEINTLKIPVVNRIKMVLSECLTSLVEFIDPSIQLNIEYIEFDSDTLELDSENYLSVNVARLVTIDAYDRAASGYSIAGRTIISMYSGSIDRSTGNKYNKYTFSISPYLPEEDYNINYSLEWYRRDSDGDVTISEIRTSTEEPYLEFDSKKMILWVRNEDLPLGYDMAKDKYEARLTITATQLYVTAENIVKTVRVVWYKNAVGSIEFDDDSKTQFEELKEMSKVGGGIGYDIQA